MNLVKGLFLATDGDEIQAIAPEKETALEMSIFWAFAQFRSLFCASIESLLQQFPVDCKTKTGDLFWNTGNKRRPLPLQFDISNSLHLSFVLSGAALYARARSSAALASELEGFVRGYRDQQANFTKSSFFDRLQASPSGLNKSLHRRYGELSAKWRSILEKSTEAETALPLH